MEMDSSSGITSCSWFLKNPIASFTNLLLLTLVCFNKTFIVTLSSLLFLSTCSLLFLYRSRRRLQKTSTWVKNLPRGGTQCGVTEGSDHLHHQDHHHYRQDVDCHEGTDSRVSTSSSPQSELPMCALDVSSSDYTGKLQEISNSTDSSLSLSDDESLIEIDLFEVDPFGERESKPVLSLPETSPELESPNDEINEEDNLIEIDITMGSIILRSFYAD